MSIEFNFINIKESPFHAQGDGATDDTAAFNSAISKIANTGTIFIPPGVYKVASNLTFGTSTTVKFDQGAILKPSSGAVTITLASIIAGIAQQIFDISAGGKVTFAYPASTPSEKLSVKWWGAKGDNSTDDTAAIQAALDAGTNIIDTAPQPPTIGAIWPHSTVFLPHGSYVVSSAGTNIACLEMTDAITFLGENSILNCASPNQHILRSGNYFDYIEGITFLNGKSAVVLNGPSHHYGGSLGTVEAGGPNSITRCSFWHNAGPSIFLDTTIENRSSAATMFVRDCHFETSCAWHAGFDGAQVSDCYMIPSQSTLDDANAVLVYDDDGYILPFMVSYDNLILQNCVMAPQFGDQTVATTHSAWLGGLGAFTADSCRFGGESGAPILRIKANNFSYYGQSLAAITDPGSYQCLIKFDSSVLSSCAGLYWMEIYDYFPAKIDVRMLHQGIPSGLPYGNVLMESNGIWIDSVSCPKTSYLYRQRSTIVINIDNFIDLYPDFRFTTSNNVLHTFPFGEDVTGELKRYRLREFKGTEANIGVSQNYWSTGNIDYTTLTGLGSTNVAGGSTDTTTGYNIGGILCTATPGLYIAASPTAFLTTSMPAGEYTFSMAIKATANGQVGLSFYDPIVAANNFIIDTLDYSGSTPSDGYAIWQRISTSFYYDGYVNRQIAFSFYNLRSGDEFWFGLFALQKGRKVKDWTYPGNPTAQDDIVSTYYATAIPVSGTYKQGDVVLNTTPTLGSPYGWICTVGGSPGTFQLISNAGGTPGGAAGGDLSGTYPNPLVAAISGSTPINITPATLQWTTGTVNPTLTQVSTSSGSGQQMLITAQSATGAGHSGGNLILGAGNSGLSTVGSVYIQTGGTTQFQFSPTALTYTPAGGSSTLIASATSFLSQPSSYNQLLALDNYSDANVTHFRTLNTVTTYGQISASLFQALVSSFTQLSAPDVFFDATTVHIRDNMVSPNASSVMLNAGGATTFQPVTDNTGSIGVNGFRWSLIRGVTITSGDLNLTDEARGADWKFREQQTFVLAINQMTGKRMKLSMQELTAEDEAELVVNDPIYARSQK
jgi:hypothetical protein